MEDAGRRRLVPPELAFGFAAAPEARRVFAAALASRSAVVVACRRSFNAAIFLSFASNLEVAFIPAMVAVSFFDEVVLVVFVVADVRQ